MDFSRIFHGFSRFSGPEDGHRTPEITLAAKDLKDGQELLLAACHAAGAPRLSKADVEATAARTSLASASFPWVFFKDLAWCSMFLPMIFDGFQGFSMTFKSFQWLSMFFSMIFMSTCGRKSGFT